MSNKFIERFDVHLMPFAYVYQHLASILVSYKEASQKWMSSDCSKLHIGKLSRKIHCGFVPRNQQQLLTRLRNISKSYIQQIRSTFKEYCSLKIKFVIK